MRYHLRAIWFPSSLCLLAGVTGSLLLLESYFLSVFAYLFSCLMALDASSRYQEFLTHARSRMRLNPIRVIKYFQSSFCSRQVAIAIYGDAARCWYIEHGYRWYHILPDKTFSRSPVLFTKQFWKRSLGGLFK